MGSPAGAHPSHYRVMFGGVLRSAETALPPDDQSADAFGVMSGALIEMQGQGLVRREDPHLLALSVGSVVHGVAMLALDGVLQTPRDIDALRRFANEGRWAGIGLGSGPWRPAVRE